MQGRRPTMEDAHFVVNSAKVGDVVGVLDGCGGANASTFCSMAMQRSVGGASSRDDTVRVLETAFESVERLVLEAAEAKRWVDATTGATKGSFHCHLLSSYECFVAITKVSRNTHPLSSRETSRRDDHPEVGPPTRDELLKPRSMGTPGETRERASGKRV